MTVLKLDVDRAPCPRVIGRIGHLTRLCGWRVRWLAYTRTRRGWHLEVALRGAVPLLAVVAAQAVLGSDRARETFNLARAVCVVRGGVPRYWRERVNVLFSRKVA